MSSEVCVRSVIHTVEHLCYVILCNFATGNEQLSFIKWRILIRGFFGLDFVIRSFFGVACRTIFEKVTKNFSALLFVLLGCLHVCTFAVGAFISFSYSRTLHLAHSRSGPINVILVFSSLKANNCNFAPQESIIYKRLAKRFWWALFCPCELGFELSLSSFSSCSPRVILS